MKLVIFFLLFAANAAVAQFRCPPKTALSPTACGTPYREVNTPEGQCEVWWSPLPATASAPNGSWNIERRCCLTKYCSLPNVKPMEVVKQIASHASGVLAGLNAALAQLSTPPANAYEAYQLALLRWHACEDARQNVALMIEPAASRPAPPDTWCGPQPQPVAVPAEVWIVTPNPSAPTRPAYGWVNGKRELISRVTVVTNSTTCDCAAVKATEYGLVTYCAVPRNALTPAQSAGVFVTACQLKK